MNSATDGSNRLDDLLAYCKERDWAGYDPFDGLNSRLFPSSISTRIVRLAWIQFFKRCPINLRKLALVPRGHNPKGLALFASAMIVLDRSADANSLLDRLIGLRSKGWSTACWGYNFDWQTRGYLIPQFAPNIICTSFAGSALLDAYDKYRNSEFLDIAQSAGRFILQKLKRTGSSTEFCFSYTPLLPSRVHNASLLGAALLARLYAYTGEKEMREAAMAAARYSIGRQQDDGAWPYGEDKKQTWVDSFHTGYNLLALRDIGKYTKCESVDEAMTKGFAYYRSRFFPGNGIVKYYQDRIYPIDAHAVAHAILTLTQLRSLHSGNLALAESILEWAGKEMRAPSGYYYYQKWPQFVIRIPYMRWSQAWMLYAMASFAQAQRHNLQQ